jgi:hypothetical protein
VCAVRAELDAKALHPHCPVVEAVEVREREPPRRRRPARRGVAVPTSGA